MTKHHDDTPDTSELRQLAEAKIKEMHSKDESPLHEVDARRLVYELQVHQIELEMQHDELCRTQRDLEESRDLYFDLYDLAPVGYLVLSAKGIIVEANLTASKMLAVTRDSLIDSALVRYIHTEDQDFFIHCLSGLLDQDEPHICELRLLPVRNSTMWVRADLTATKSKDGRVLLRAVLSDITQQKRIENELRLYEWLTEKDEPTLHQHGTLYSSEYDDPTALNTPRLILDGIGHDALARMAEDLLTLLDTCVAIYEANGDYAYCKFDSAWCQAMDNASFRLCDCNSTKEAISSGRWLCHVNCWNDSAKAAMESGQPTDIQCVGGIRLYAVPIRSGDTIVGAINIGYGSPPKDDKRIHELAEKFNIDPHHLHRRSHAYKPRPPFIINVAKTRCASMAHMIGQSLEKQRIEQEKAVLEDQLRQSQKMESIGRLAGGIAHDFNNILTAIIGFAECIHDALDGQDPLLNDVDEILSAGHSAATLTAQLLAFSRKQLISPKVVDLDKALLRTQKLLHRLLGDDIVVQIVSDNTLHLVKIDPGQLDQILVNLSINAGDAMLNGGKITIEVQNVVIERAHSGDRDKEMFGEFIMLSFSDTGTGISPEILHNIFEPFFSTKAQGKGTGLGLSTVYGIVKQNNGHIKASSVVGEGTKFTIYLPQIKGEPIEAGDEVEVTAVSGSETIMLVEDQPTVRKLVKRVLHKKGYTIIEAENGEDALRKFNQIDGKIDLLVSDVVMPLMNGKDLYNRLLGVRPELKALFMSGYTEDTIAHHGVLEAGTNFIQKPFKPQILAQKVRLILDSEPASETDLPQ